ncbi:hypothetical protein QWZ08_02340 [Ferruginibacter paludis]|uniref:hypothetical protein n=1 Tax=Ferruginibacter paludis TaxID=1310417 RepID=UPI0025B2DB5F|nr:hypothetical protein [Ferruginibacter paludis]MDN3654446.1 hypothetical protein [Ferruginibacter paludis]
MKKIPLFTTLAVSLFIISCKKEDSTAGNNTDPLKGHWKFLTMKANTKATMAYDFGGTTMVSITTSDYTTTNGVGSFSFANGTATTLGIGYSLETNVFTASYENGQLTDTMSMPMSFTASPTNSSGQYKIIGNDSVYFPAGGIISGNVPGSNNSATMASGYKFTIAGDTLLTMTGHLVKDSIANMSGVIASLREEVNYISSGENNNLTTISSLYIQDDFLFFLGYCL